MKKETTKPKPPVKKEANAEEAPKARPKYFFREGMTIRDAAERIGLKPKDLIEKLSSQGSLQEQNDLLDEAVTAAIGRGLEADVEFLGYEQELRRRAEAGAG